MLMHTILSLCVGQPLPAVQDRTGPCQGGREEGLSAGALVSRLPPIRWPHVGHRAVSL